MNPDQSADTVRWNGCTCAVFNGTHSPFPRLTWDEDCPHHGRGVNPYWDEMDDDESDGEA